MITAETRAMDNDGHNNGDQDSNWTSDDSDSDSFSDDFNCNSNDDKNSNEDEDADSWFFPMDKPDNHMNIADLMRFVHRRQTPYSKKKVFTREQMTAETPMRVRNWLL